MRAPRNFRCAAQAMPLKDRAEGHVVYVGDGVATWGETKADPLAEFRQ